MCPNSAIIKKWRDEVYFDNSKIKIGLAWAGSPIHKRDRHRSCSLEIFAALTQLDNVTFYSLQKGNAAQQLYELSEELKLVDCMKNIRDFSDTAALISNLDLVISVDTAVAHLAGALGKEVWTFIPFTPDWRWLLHREDSPWYPTMKLFRQPSLGDWESVVKKAMKELHNKLQKL